MTSNVIPFRPRTTTATTSAPHGSTTATAPETGLAVYTVKETAELLSLSLGSTYNLIRSGEIPGKKLGGRWVVPKRRLHAWLDGTPEATTEDLDREFARLDREHQGKTS